MGLFKRRVKSAVKCLFGLQEASTPITTHEYHLIVDDIKKLEGMVVFVTGGTGETTHNSRLPTSVIDHYI